MYIKINSKQYPCTGYKPTITAVHFTAGGVTLPISDTISLHADDGFTLVEAINPADYARHLYEGGALTLTNEPEPEPYIPPEPTEPVIDDITALQLAVAELAEIQLADQTANELALAELAEIVLGG